MIEQKDSKVNNHSKNFWCHLCKQKFLSSLIPGADDIICPKCSGDFCEVFTDKSNPNRYEPYQKSLRTKNRRISRITAQAVMVALAQFSQESKVEKKREITEEDVRKLRVKVDKVLDQCLICKQQMRLNSEVLMCPCQHFFHIDCLSQWLEYKNNCPKCRAQILNNLQS